MLRQQVNQQDRGGMQVAVGALDGCSSPAIQWSLKKTFAYARFFDMAQQVIDRLDDPLLVRTRLSIAKRQSGGPGDAVGLDACLTRLRFGPEEPARLQVITRACGCWRHSGLTSSSTVRRTRGWGRRSGRLVHGHLFRGSWNPGRDHRSHRVVADGLATEIGERGRRPDPRGSSWT